MFRHDGMGTLKAPPSSVYPFKMGGPVQGVTKPLKHTTGSTEAAGSAAGTVDSHGRAENGKWLSSS